MTSQSFKKENNTAFRRQERRDMVNLCTRLVLSLALSVVWTSILTRYPRVPLSKLNSDSELNSIIRWWPAINHFHNAISVSRSRQMRSSTQYAASSHQ